MPRAVFKLLWDTLAQGQPICAYVENMAKDGCYYWVLALVAPTPDGYLSVRFKPSSPLFTLVEAVYHEMRAIEVAAEQRGESGEKAMAASTAHLLAALAAHGFADYGTFMRSALLRTELASHDAGIAQSGQDMFGDLRSAGGDPLLMALHRACVDGRETHAALCCHLVSLNEWSQMDAALQEASASILGHACDVGNIALNVTFRAGKLGHTGNGVAVIANCLHQSSLKCGAIVSDISRRIAVVSESLSRVMFDLAWLRLQYEMVVIYEHEIVEDLGVSGHDITMAQLRTRWSMLKGLGLAFDATGRSVLLELSELARAVQEVTTNSETLRQIIMSLRVARLGGLVESSRFPDNPFLTIFAEVDTQIEGTTTQLRLFNDIAARVRVLSAGAAVIGVDIQAASERLSAEANALAQLTQQRGESGADAASQAPDTLEVTPTGDFRVEAALLRAA